MSSSIFISKFKFIIKNIPQNKLQTRIASLANMPQNKTFQRKEKCAEE